MIKLTQVGGIKLYVAPNQIATIESRRYGERGGARVQLATDGVWYIVEEFASDIAELVEKDREPKP